MEGRNTLGKIQKQLLVCADEDHKLDLLKIQYVEENTRWKSGDVVGFWQYDDKPIKGRIGHIKYVENGKSLICYQLIRVNNDHTPNKRDLSFYYRTENEIF